MMIHADGINSAGTQNAAKRKLRADAVSVRAHMPEHGNPFSFKFFQQCRKACTFFFKILFHKIFGKNGRSDRKIASP